MAKDEGNSHNHIVEGLMDRRTVVLSGDINPQSASEAGRSLLTLQLQSSSPINLIIDSGGGSVDAALQLCDLMSVVMTAPVRGIALGACGSAATFIMLYCSERLGTLHSRFLIHSGTRSKISIPMNQSTSENLEQLTREVKATEEMLLNLYTKRLTPAKWLDITPEADRRKFVQDLVARGDQRFDDWMSVQEAIEVGLIQKIINEKLGIFQN